MHKVRYTGSTDAQAQWGGNDDPRGLLVEGETYTLAGRDIHSFHTKYALQEFPGRWFNSVSFKDAA